MPSCPSCRRPVAVARPSCLYCGAPLAPQDVAAAAAAAGPAPPPPEAEPRGLLILDLADATPEILARALGLPPYEAGLLARRGGLHLRRALEARAASAEARRLAGLGVVAVVVPEAEARARPLRALSGRRTPAGLSLRTEEGPLEVAEADLLLLVTGPIVRQRQSRFDEKRAPARLDEGRRVHLHRRSEPRAVEIDPDNFEAGGGAGSARLEVDAWVADLAARVPHDEDFRREPPALAPGEPEPPSPLAAAASLRARSARRRPPRRPGGTEEEPSLLDNVAQFRFYSGWRAAVARRRAAPPSAC
jgi:hypothetical protein